MTEQEVYYDFMQHWQWYKDHFGDNMDETFRAILKSFVARYTEQTVPCWVGKRKEAKVIDDYADIHGSEDEWFI